MTMDQAPKAVEVWKNVAKGMRWYTKFDRTGRETTDRVQGGKTFTLTPFERQINQEMAATPDLDLFRNGNFVLVRGSDETLEDEISSTSALTNQELEEMVLEVVTDPDQLEEVLLRLKGSIVGLDRFKEFMIADGAKPDLIAAVNTAFYEADGSTPATRRRIITGEHAETAPAE